MPKSYTETLPARFASALVNNDFSGYSSAELEELDDIMQSCKNAACVSDSYIVEFNGLICEVADFTFYY